MEKTKNRESLPGGFISDQYEIPVHFLPQLPLELLDFGNPFRGNVRHFKVIQ